MLLKWGFTWEEEPSFPGDGVANRSKVTFSMGDGEGMPSLQETQPATALRCLMGRRGRGEEGSEG